MYDQIEIFRNQVVTVFLRYHTFAPYYSSRLGNPGNFCVCNPECRKLFPVQSRIQVPLTRNHNPLPGIPNSQHGIKNLITLSGAIIYLFIYLFIYSMLTGSKASLSRWLAFARSNRRHGNQRWWIENCYTGLYLVYSIWAWLTATVVINYQSIDKFWVCLWRVEGICNVFQQQRSIVIKLSESCWSLIKFSPICDTLESSYLRK